MELNALRLVALAILPATLLLTGCKDDSTRAEWTAKISTEPYNPGPYGDAIITPRIDKIADGYHVISGSHTAELFDSTRLDTKGRVISTQNKIGDIDRKMQTTRSGLVISECCHNAQTTTARAKDGTVIWSRDIVPGMPANSESDTTDFIHQSQLRSADSNASQALLTGLDALGQVRWQRIIPNASGIQDAAGGFCYTSAINERLFLSCVDNEGQDTFKSDISFHPGGQWSADHQRIASFNNDELVVFDRGGALIASINTGQASKAPAELYSKFIGHIVIGADQRVHATLISIDPYDLANKGAATEVFSVSATGELSSAILPIISLHPGSQAGVGLMTVDPEGSVYVTGSETGDTLLGKIRLETWRPVVYRIDADGAKPVIKGRKTSHSPIDPSNYTCNGGLCAVIRNLQTFSSLQAQEDGSLMVGWSNSTWQAYQWAPAAVLPADFHVSKFPAKNFTN